MTDLPLFFKIKMTGNNVRALKPDPTMLRKISNPKYWSGTISENRSTRNPADTDITLMIMAFPLILIVSSSASVIDAPFFKESLKWVMTWME